MWTKLTTHVGMEMALQSVQCPHSVPVGAALFYNERFLCAAQNQETSATAHAELRVLQDGASLLQKKYLTQCDLYVTLEPCAMCAGAINLSRIRRLYFGAYSPKTGAVAHGPRLLDHTQTEWIGGICETQCARLMHSFFAQQRKSKL